MGAIIKSLEIDAKNLWFMDMQRESEDLNIIKNLEKEGICQLKIWMENDVKEFVLEKWKKWISEMCEV